MTWLEGGPTERVICWIQAHAVAGFIFLQQTSCIRTVMTTWHCDSVFSWSCCGLSILKMNVWVVLEITSKHLWALRSRNHTLLSHSCSRPPTRRGPISARKLLEDFCVFFQLWVRTSGAGGSRPKLKWILFFIFVFSSDWTWHMTASVSGVLLNQCTHDN